MVCEIFKNYISLLKCYFVLIVFYFVFLEPSYCSLPVDESILLSSSIGLVTREHIIFNMATTIEIAKVLKKVTSNWQMVPLYRHPVFSNTADAIVTDHTSVITLQFCTNDNGFFIAEELNNLIKYCKPTTDLMILFCMTNEDFERTVAAWKEIGSPEFFSIQQLQLQLDFNFPDDGFSEFYEKLFVQAAMISNKPFCVFIQRAYDKDPAKWKTMLSGDSPIDFATSTARDEMMAFLRSDHSLLSQQIVDFWNKELEKPKP